MANLSQGEFGRVARGVPIAAGMAPDIEKFILGMGHSARAAIRRVHHEDTTAARAYFATKVSGYLLQGGAVAARARTLRACIEQYISWDVYAGPAITPAMNKPVPVPFNPDHIVRAYADILIDGTGGYEARVLLFDDVPLSRDAAELIALPVVEYVESEHGAGSAASVSVWQLERGERESVTPHDASARRADVEALLASI